jgi:hypothetical protein
MDTPNLVCLTINQNALFRLSIMRIRVFKYPVRPSTQADTAFPHGAWERGNNTEFI